MDKIAVRKQFETCQNFRWIWATLVFCHGDAAADEGGSDIATRGGTAPLEPDGPPETLIATLSAQRRHPYRLLENPTTLAINLPSPTGLPTPAAGNPDPLPDLPQASSWNTLPPELQHMIASRLQGRDQLHFAQTSKRYFAMLQPELQKMRLSARIRNAADISALHALLGTRRAPAANPVQGTADNMVDDAPETIHDAPAPTRDELLAALASRIVALPLHQHGPATALWRASAQPLAAQHLGIRTELQQQEKSVRLCDRVEHMNTFADVRSLLGTELDTQAQETIASLPPHLQVKPLMVLVSRMAMLPNADQHAAMDLFATAVAALPEDAYANLTALEEEARNSRNVDALHEIACFSAVRSGESVADTVRRSGATDASLISVLTFTAWGVAVKNGMPPDEAAAAVGITDPHQLDQARYFMASEDLDQGETSATVIARYQITDPDEVNELMEPAINSACVDILNGMPMAEAAATNGITSADHLQQLSDIAFEAAAAFIQTGASAQQSIERFHISDPAHIAGLSRAATQAAVAAILDNGVPVQAAAATYGIHAPGQRAELIRAAINSARVDVRNGTSVPVAAARWGIVEPADIAQLSAEAALEAATMIARYGITDPRHLSILNTLRSQPASPPAPWNSGASSATESSGSES